MCVHQGMIAATAGFEPGISRFKVNHATKELSWHSISIQIFLLESQTQMSTTAIDNISK